MLSVCGEVFTRDVGSTMANMAMIMPTIIGNRYGQIFSHFIVERNLKLIFLEADIYFAIRGHSEELRLVRCSEQEKAYQTNGLRQILQVSSASC